MIEKIKEIIKADTAVKCAGLPYYVENPHLVSHAEETINNLIKALPSGSGFDDKAHVMYASNSAVAFKVPYHCMEDGFYCGWAYFKVRMLPTFDGYYIDVSLIEWDTEEAKQVAENILDYIDDCYAESLANYLN